MTVGDLKEALDHYDDDARVVMGHYKEGFEEVSEMEVIAIHFDKNGKLWYRPYEAIVGGPKEGDEKTLWIHSQPLMR